MSEKNIPIADFENSIKQLEDTIQLMESGQLTLEESLTKFELGVTLIKNCQTTLKNATQKIHILTNNGTLDEYENN